MPLKIDHVAIWVTDLAGAKRFYETYFGLQAGERYHNPTKGFISYFLSDPANPAEARLELMSRVKISNIEAKRTFDAGWNHVAFRLGSESAVDALTDRLRSDGYTIADGPRWTGDGYYESVVLDPEGNRIELVK